MLFEKIHHHYEGNLKGRTFAIWGLAFKPNTDDMRDAPSRTILEHLFAEGATVRAYDPAALAEAKRIYGDRADLVLCTERDDTLHGADALVVITEWNEFRSPDFHAIKARLSEPAIFDGRNLYDPDYLKQLGFAYYAIGRGNLS